MGDVLTRNDRIQINLAQITKSPSDTFKVIRASNEKDFVCELCGQKHVTKVYTVLNTNTELTIRIGCECVKHFNISKSDLDVAEGFLKRVEQSIRESKKELIEREGTRLFNALPDSEKPKSYSKKNEKILALGNEYFQSLPLKERSEFYYSAYMMHEAIRLYGGGASGYDNLTYIYQKGTYIYSQEEINVAVEKIGCRDIFEKKIADIDGKKVVQRRSALLFKCTRLIDEYRKERKHIEDDVASKIVEEAKEFGMGEEIAHKFEEYKQGLDDLLAREEKYPQIFNYAGSSYFVKNIQRKLYTEDINEEDVRQVNLVIEREAKEVLNKKNEEPSEIKKMVEALVAARPNNNFYRSIHDQYLSRGSISPNQESCIRVDYKKIIKESVE